MPKKLANKKKDRKNIIKKLKEEIKSLKITIDKNNEKNILLLAEFDNYKKRSIQQRKDSAKYEGTNIFIKIIPILDDIDRVIEAKITKKDHTVIDGINLIKNKFLVVLNEFGIQSYDSVDKEFNPDYHEAIMTKKTKKKSNVIIKEYEKGYTQYDKVIRYAKVVVSK